MPSIPEEFIHEIHGGKRPKERKPPNPQRCRLWMVLALTAFAGIIFGGVGAWWRTEKINVGYCGVGKSQWTMPSWLRRAVAPQCETCPAHAHCAAPFYARCDEDYRLHESRLGLWGLIPRPPRCEATTARARQITQLAQDISQEVRRTRSPWSCDPPPEITVEQTKHAVERRWESGGKPWNIDGDTWSLALEEALQDGHIEICSGETHANITLASSSPSPLCRARTFMMQLYTIYAYAVSVIVLLFSRRCPVFRRFQIPKRVQRSPAPDAVAAEDHNSGLPLRRSSRQRRPQKNQFAS
jgi:hypothetical protein